MKGAEKVVYGYDDARRLMLTGQDYRIVIVEGEMDKLALEEAGLPNHTAVISVPDGEGGGVPVQVDV